MLPGATISPLQSTTPIPESLFPALRSQLSLNTIHSTNTVITDGVLEVSLGDLCRVIDDHLSLQKALIISTRTYVERRALVAPHRCLVLHLRRTGRDDIWLRLDRRPTGGASLMKGLGTTPANDIVRLSSGVVTRTTHIRFHEGSFGKRH
jgi:hypothetical protein